MLHAIFVSYKHSISLDSFNKLKWKCSSNSCVQCLSIVLLYYSTTKVKQYSVKSNFYWHFYCWKHCCLLVILKELLSQYSCAKDRKGQLNSVVFCIYHMYTFLTITYSLWNITKGRQKQGRFVYIVSGVSMTIRIITLPESISIRYYHLKCHSSFFFFFYIGWLLSLLCRIYLVFSVIFCTSLF